MDENKKDSCMTAGSYMSLVISSKPSPMGYDVDLKHADMRANYSLMRGYSTVKL